MLSKREVVRGLLESPLYLTMRAPERLELVRRVMGERIRRQPSRTLIELLMMQHPALEGVA